MPVEGVTGTTEEAVTTEPFYAVTKADVTVVENAVTEVAVSTVADSAATKEIVSFTIPLAVNVSLMLVDSGENQSEVDAWAKDVPTVAVGPSTKRRLCKHVDHQNDGTKTHVAQQRAHKRKVGKGGASEEEAVVLDDSMSVPGVTNNNEALVDFPPWVLPDGKLDWILLS
jgi:hypothetical protein